ncbi:molybdopterin-dependent oxidoreductase [Paenibacillus sp. MB22_1]|uniref:molybdopterin-dependent oxidoreductase n=1 Tax=Paenibacillus sp. MB22_1 TaxID=3383121 RepID=UPI0039A2F2A6
MKDAQVLQSAFAEDSFGRNITQTTYRDPLGHDPSSGSGIRRGKARNGSYRAGVGAAGERRGAYAAVHVVVDLFETETSAYADWLLPGTSFLEVEETMTNLEGRVFCRPRVFEPAGAALPDAWLLCALAERPGPLDHAARVAGGRRQGDGGHPSAHEVCPVPLERRLSCEPADERRPAPRQPNAGV